VTNKRVLRLVRVFLRTGARDDAPHSQWGGHRTQEHVATIYGAVSDEPDLDLDCPRVDTGASDNWINYLGPTCRVIGALPVERQVAGEPGGDHTPIHFLQLVFFFDAGRSGGRRRIEKSLARLRPVGPVGIERRDDAGCVPANLAWLERVTSPALLHFNLAFLDQRQEGQFLFVAPCPIQRVRGSAGEPLLCVVERYPL